MTQRNIVFNILIAVILFCFLLGCARTGDGRRTQGEGAALGAAIGALAGQILGEDTESTLIGSTIGGTLGYIAGTEIQKKKEQYVIAERSLNDEIKNMANTNSELKTYIANLRNDLKNLKNHSNNLVAKYKQQKKYRDELARLKNAIRSKVDKNNKIIASLNNEVDEKKQILSHGGEAGLYSALQKEVNLLERNIEDLQNYNDQLALVDDRISL